MKISFVKTNDDSGQECYKNDKNDSKIKNLVIKFNDKMLFLFACLFAWCLTAHQHKKAISAKNR